MRLLDALLGRSDRSLLDVGMGGGFLYQTYTSPDSEKIQPTFANACEAYGTSGVVFGVILARMSLFAEAEFKYQRLSDRSLFGTQALRILEEPWPGGTTGELLSRMEQDASLAGNAFVRKVNPLLLERLRPDWVTIVSELLYDTSGREYRQVVGYHYDPPEYAKRESAFYDVAEVAHWSPNPDPLATYRGMSWLTPVLREIDADRQLTDYKRSYLENSATPNIIVMYSDRVGDTKMKRIREQIQARHTGPRNAFKTMILDEGADPMTVGSTFEHMQFSDVQAAGENRIAVAAGVPGIVAGLREGLQAATYSNYEQAMRRFADVTMRPLWRSACSSLSKLIDPQQGARLWFDTTAIAALRQGEKEQADTMLVLSQAAQALVMSGYTPESINAALSSGDVTLLEHSGLVSVQMQALQEQKDANVPPPSNADLQVKVPKTKNPESPQEGS